MNVFFILMSFAGYILPVPALIWAWVRWWKVRPRFTPDRWRRISTFGGLILASLVALFMLFAMYAMARWSGLPANAFVVLAAIGLVGSVFALMFSLMGEGPARVPAILASVGLATLWFIGPFP